ncbi:unnamed protein product [Prunus armeniaca]
MSPVTSVTGFRYYVLFTDEYSRYSWIYPMRRKSEVFSHFQKFVAMVKNIFGTSVKYLQSDNGMEYVNTSFTTLCNSLGIQQRFSCPHTPQQNGLAERKHRHIATMTRILLNTSHMPLNLWVEAALTSVHLINLLPTPILNWSTPYSILFSKPPTYSHLRVFGCSCFPFLGPYVNHKLLSRSLECVFIGYSLHHKGYRCLDPSTGRVYTSRHVIFNEDCFPFTQLQVSSSSPYVALNLSPLPTVPLPPPPVAHLPIDPVQPPPLDPVSPGPTTQPTPVGPNSSTAQSGPADSTSQSAYVDAPASQSVLIDSITHAEHVSTSAPMGPIDLANPAPCSIAALPNSHVAIEPMPLITANQPAPHPMVTRSRTGTLHPKIRTDGTVRYPISHALLAAVTDQEPTCFSQAQKHVEWRDAMTEEINALLKNNTWTLVPSTPSQNTIGCKWVFWIKRTSDGRIEHYKARLVAKCFHQQPGIDYAETFSPVVKPATIRTVLTIAISRGWSLRQLDVKNAFLHGILHEDVYMAQPPGFVDPTRPNYVCKLHKALYGLKQAPRAWFHRISSFLLSFGFQHSQSDSSLFIFRHASYVIFLLLYVDDIVVTGNYSRFLHHFITALGLAFDIKDLGPLHFFLGLQVTTTSDGLHISQLKYAYDLLQRHGMLHCKPANTPLAAKVPLSASDGVPLESPSDYREIVGSLQYLTLTRPDLSFAVSSIAQFMAAPRTSHLVAAKRILRYVKGTLDFGLSLSPQPSTARLSAYSDADWAGCPDSRRSTSGYLIYLGSNLISWCSKKQPTVARSSAESEYCSLAHSCAETTWLSYLISELGVSLHFPILLHCDNLSTTYMAANPVFHARTHHIELDYHFVREKVALGSHQVRYIPSIDQPADLLTKALHKPRHALLRSKLVQPGLSSFRGGNQSHYFVH